MTTTIGGVLRKCTVCGEPLTGEGARIECRFCGSVYQFSNPQMEDELQTANAFRECTRFEEAETLYKQILKKYREYDLSEVYWNLFLCEQRVMFETDEKGERFPSFYAITDDAVEDSLYYLGAIGAAEKKAPERVEIFKTLAEKMIRVKQLYARIADTSKPFDMFICFKKSAFEGGDTKDFALATDLYNHLAKDYNIFFSERSLKNVVVREFEPNIYYGLYTAKVMLVLCSKKEYVESQWLKNEWSRFHAFAQNPATGKTIIPIFLEDFSPRSLPNELMSYQGLPADYHLFDELGKTLRNILKPVDMEAELDRRMRELMAEQQRLESERAEAQRRREEEQRLREEEQRRQEEERAEAQRRREEEQRRQMEEQQRQMQEQLEAMRKAQEQAKSMPTLDLSASALSTSDIVTPLLKRAFMFAEDKNWDSANAYFEKVLDKDPENGRAYLGKMLVSFHASSIEALQQVGLKIEQDSNYQKILRFGDKQLKNTLEGYIAAAKQRILDEQTESVYLEACSLMREHNIEHYRLAIDKFSTIPDWKDAQEKIELCEREIQLIIDAAEAERKNNIYATACSLMRQHTTAALTEALEMFQSIAGWKDASANINKCEQELQSILTASEIERKDSIYISACALMQKQTYDSLTKAIQKFTSISDWKDSSTKISLCIELQNKESLKSKQFSIQNGELIAYHGMGGDVEIPLDVKIIGKNAFRGHIKITSITIPYGVTKIDDCAFHWCQHLSNITIPNSVTSIGKYAFSGCTSLTDITLPKSLTSLGDSAFHACYSLKSITIPPNVKSIGHSTFYDCNMLKSINLSDGISSIGRYAFSGCIKLERISIPASVTCIGDHAFSDCISLKSLLLFHGLQSIDMWAFNSCSSLTNVVIPESVTVIGEYAFLGCTALSEVTLPSYLTSISSNTFAYCTELRAVTIPDHVTNVKSAAFSHCKNLLSITLPQKISTIGSEAFFNCTSLTSITLSDHIDSIGEKAFGGCTALERINAPIAIKHLIKKQIQGKV